MKAKGVLEAIENWTDSKGNQHHTFKLQGVEKGFGAWGNADPKYKAGQTVEIDYDVNGNYNNVVQDKKTKVVSVSILEQSTLTATPKKAEAKPSDSELIEGVLSDYRKVYEGVKEILGKDPQEITDGLTQVSTAYIELGKRRRNEKW